MLTTQAEGEQRAGKLKAVPPRITVERKKRQGSGGCGDGGGGKGS